MTGTVKRRNRLFAWALLCSLALHLWVASAPGWRTPEDELPDLPPLVARLAPPPPVVQDTPPARPRPAPKPRPKPRPHAAPKPNPAPVVAPESPAAPVAPEGPPAPPPSKEPPASDSAPPAPATSGPVEGDQPPVSIALPGRGTLRYVVIWGEQKFEIGRAIHRWVHDGKTYEIQTLIETTGLAALRKSLKLVQISHGEVTDKGLRPKEFLGERRSGEEPTERASFDWAANRVILVSGDRRREAVLVPGAQDFASAWYQLGLEAPGRDRVEMMVATGKSYKKKVFERGPQEMLETRAGPIEAVHWRTTPEPDEDRVEVWLAPKYHQVPVRIRYTDRKGEVIDQMLSELDLDGVHLAERPRPPDNPFLHH